MKRRMVVWQSRAGIGLERCTLISSRDGFELSGVMIRVVDQKPYVLRYTIEVDGGWATRTVQLDVENGTHGTLSLVRDLDGRWARDGDRAPELDGLVDVDIEWTPATNTLPIRRLQLAAGESRNVTAAWIRCPSFDIEPLQQSYERVQPDRYLYRAGDFTADLEVDDDGLVTRYGAAWLAVGGHATS